MDGVEGTEGVSTIGELFSQILAADRPRDVPDYWISTEVQLRRRHRSVVGTIPAHMADSAGIDRTDPPEVPVHYDPTLQMVCFDFGALEDNR